MSLLAIAPWFAAVLLIMAAVGAAAQQFLRRPPGNFSELPVAKLGSPRRGQYLILLLLFAGFALYGSLIPFQFISLGIAEAGESFAHILRRNVVVDSRSDWLANVLLAVPLGFCGLAALAVDRPRSARLLWQIALVIAVCAAFSTALEFLQLWVPARTSSQNDIAAQTLGTMLGIVLWIVAGQHFTSWVRVFFATRWSNLRGDRILQFYCVVLFIYGVLPLDLTISPAQLYHKFHDNWRTASRPGREMNYRQTASPARWAVRCCLPHWACWQRAGVQAVSTGNR